MSALFIILAILAFLGIIASTVFKRVVQSELDKLEKLNTEDFGTGEMRRYHELKDTNTARLSLASWFRKLSAGTFAVCTTAAMAIGSVFYLEPGYNAHGRDFFGNEFGYTTQGWHFSGWGKYNSDWKKYFTVATTTETDVDASVVKPAYRVRMLDQVDGLLSTTVRYKLPEDPDQFLAIARAYRNPGNLLSTALVPPIRETMNATSSTMGAEEYYNGGRTEFASEFADMMREGIFSLKRIEKIVDSLVIHKGSANAAKGEDQDNYGENKKITFNVEKELDPATNLPIRKAHNFLSWGITVETAIVTDFDPNTEFDERMKLKQKASADRAIAREQRVQEEEQKLLAEARGAREVAEAQAAELKVQIQQTTQAETEKQLAITAATRLKESAAIAEETATIDLRIAKLAAQGVKVTADADAYRKRELMKADGSLRDKLDTYLKTQEAWATAYANRKVPQMVMGTSGTGGNADASEFQAMLNAMIAKDLLVNTNVTK